MRSVVADDPVAPEGGHSVDVKANTAPALRRACVPGGSRIEGLPAVSREVSLDPRVGVLGADDVVARKVVEFVAAEAVHHTRRNAKSAQHYGHGRCEVFAVALFAFEQKIGNGILDGDFGKLKRIA